MGKHPLWFFGKSGLLRPGHPKGWWGAGQKPQLRLSPLGHHQWCLWLSLAPKNRPWGACKWRERASLPSLCQCGHRLPGQPCKSFPAMVPKNGVRTGSLQHLREEVGFPISNGLLTLKVEVFPWPSVAGHCLKASLGPFKTARHVSKEHPTSWLRQFKGMKYRNYLQQDKDASRAIGADATYRQAICLLLAGYASPAQAWKNATF